MVSYMSVVLATCILVCKGAPEEDLITSLPGADFDIAFAQYSGYLSGGENKYLHYWFTESQRDPTTDPVILWLNGGPGCSSLNGLFAELGPFKIDSDGVTVLPNPYSWNLNASVIFLEAPTCVGFSYETDDNGCQHSDDEVSLANYKALQDFFSNKFPEYRENDLYLTGESYAGIYIPTLSERVVQGLEDYALSFKGFAVGNGMLSYETNDNSVFFYAYHYGILGAEKWGKLVKACCDEGVPSKTGCHFHYPSDLTCTETIIEAYNVMYSGNFNYYSIYNECKHSGENKLSNSTMPEYGRVDADLDNLFRDAKKKAGVTKTKSPRGDPACIDSSNIVTWLNSPEVREAIHIPADVQDWTLCNDLVGQLFERQHLDVSAQFNYLLPNVKALVFNGDWDLSVNHLGNKWFLETLQLTELTDYKEWYYDGQVAGFYRQYTNLDWVQVNAAGHTVPEDQPGRALKMIYSWIEGIPF